MHLTFKCLNQAGHRVHTIQQQKDLGETTSPLTLIWSEFQRNFFLCLQSNFLFTFWPLNKVQLLDPLNCSLPPSCVKGEPVFLWNWKGLEGWRLLVEHSKHNTPLSKYPIRSSSMTANSIPCSYRSLHNVQGSKLCPAFMKRGFSNNRPSELQLIKAVTRRGIWDIKAEKFTCALNQFMTPLFHREIAWYEGNSRRIFCKLSIKRQRICRGQCCLGMSGCWCRRDVPQRGFRVAVVNQAARSL